LKYKFRGKNMKKNLELDTNTNTKAEVLHYSYGRINREILTLKPFCELKQSSTPLEKGVDRKSYWSASTVQREIKKLLESSAFKNSPHSAYLEVYQRMTEQRDIARCTQGNPMCPKDFLDQRLNDAMSDLMTRNYLEIVNICVSEPNKKISSGLDLGAVFQRMHRKAEKENWDSVRVAMGSTALYLTSHLALAVSALPHIDQLWIGTPYKDVNSRINRVKEFKPVYDAFNPFLAKNLVTVAKALKEAKLTGNSSFESTAKFAEPILPWEKFFGIMRDGAFKSGLDIAAHTPKGEHPWTVRDAKGNTRMLSKVVGALPFPYNMELQKDLKKLENNAWISSMHLANPLTKIFNGKTYTKTTNEGLAIN
jgi:hypothetical protein